MKQLFQLVFFLIFTVSTCYSQLGEWSYSPIPENGVYFSGDTVTICLNLENVELIWTGGAWLHGVEFTFDDSWNIGTPIDTSAPLEPCGISGGEFLWFDASLEYGSGWYYDANVGGPQDGNPWNNWGVFCDIPSDIGEFCITLVLPNSIYGFETYANGFANAAPSARATSDSWLNNEPIDLAPAPPLLIANCDDEIIFETDTIFSCSSDMINLNNYLTTSSDPGGLWTGADGSILSGGWFIPSIHAFGVYTYTWMSSSCTFSQPFHILDGSPLGQLGEAEISFFEGIESSVELNQVDGIGPSEFGFAEDGYWENPFGESVEEGVINWPEDAPGAYTYFIPNDGECFVTYSVEISFSILPYPFNIETSYRLLPYNLTFTGLELFEADTMLGQILYFDDFGDFVLSYNPEQSITVNDLNGNGITDELGDSLTDGYAVNFYISPASLFLSDTVFFDIIYPEDCDTIYTDSLSICSSFDLNDALPDAFCGDGDWYDPFGILHPNGIVLESEFAEEGNFTYFSFLNDGCPCSAQLNLVPSEDTDSDGICDDSEIVGCQDPTADNYNPDATDPGPCGQEAVVIDGPSTVSFPAGSALGGRPSPDFTAFPNPLKEGNLTIQFSGSSLGGRVVVYDLLGKVVFQNVVQYEQNLLTIPASQFIASGVYLVSFKNIDGHSSHQKVMVSE